MDTGRQCTAQKASDSFAEQVKAATWNAHGDAEQHGFIRALLAGRLPREGYAAMVAQHYFAYVALEEVGRGLADDPVAGAVIHPGLLRVPALERDLTVLYGPDWPDRIVPSPPTRTYVARIRQMADDPGGYVAHHYTRYLGDLSGGQFIRTIAARAYGLDGSGGVDFYVFDQLKSLPKFKEEYRSRPDRLPLNESARRRIIREAHLAYQLNVEVLDDLGRTHRAGLAA